MPTPPADNRTWILKAIQSLMARSPEAEAIINAGRGSKIGDRYFEGSLISGGNAISDPVIANKLRAEVGRMAKALKAKGITDYTSPEAKAAIEKMGIMPTQYLRAARLLDDNAMLREALRPPPDTFTWGEKNKGYVRTPPGELDKRAQFQPGGRLIENAELEATIKEVLGRDFAKRLKSAKGNLKDIFLTDNELEAVVAKFRPPPTREGYIAEAKRQASGLAEDDLRLMRASGYGGTGGYTPVLSREQAKVYSKSLADYVKSPKITVEDGSLLVEWEGQEAVSLMEAHGILTKLGETAKTEKQRAKAMAAAGEIKDILGQNSNTQKSLPLPEGAFERADRAAARAASERIVERNHPHFLTGSAAEEELAEQVSAAENIARRGKKAKSRAARDTGGLPEPAPEVNLEALQRLMPPLTKQQLAALPPNDLGKVPTKNVVTGSQIKAAGEAVSKMPRKIQYERMPREAVVGDPGESGRIFGRSAGNYKAQVTGNLQTPSVFEDLYPPAVKPIEDRVAKLFDRLRTTTGKPRTRQQAKAERETGNYKLSKTGNQQIFQAVDEVLEIEKDIKAAVDKQAISKDVGESLLNRMMHRLVISGQADGVLRVLALRKGIPVQQFKKQKLISQPKPDERRPIQERLPSKRPVSMVLERPAPAPTPTVKPELQDYPRQEARRGEGDVSAIMKKRGKLIHPVDWERFIYDLMRQNQANKKNAPRTA